MVVKNAIRATSHALRVTAKRIMADLSPKLLKPKQNGFFKEQKKKKGLPRIPNLVRLSFTSKGRNKGRLELRRLVG